MILAAILSASFQISPACNTYMITASITTKHVIPNVSSAQRNSLRTDRLYKLRQLIVLRRRFTGFRLPVLIRRISCVSLIGLSLPSPAYAGFSIVYSIVTPSCSSRRLINTSMIFSIFTCTTSLICMRYRLSLFLRLKSCL